MYRPVTQRNLLVRPASLRSRLHVAHVLTRSCRVQVLDVNGLLIHRTRAPVAHPEGGMVEPQAQVTSYCVYDRPGLRDFIAMVLQHFVVGVWSSAKQHNLVGLVHHIFGQDAHRLAFVWGQERCTCVGYERGKPLFVKELARVWAEPPFAAFGPHCTLLVDDDAYKAGLNPPHTAIHPATFTVEAMQVDNALRIDGELCVFLQAMAQSGTRVTDWLQSNPFVNSTLPGVDDPDEQHIEPAAMEMPGEWRGGGGGPEQSARKRHTFRQHNPEWAKKRKSKKKKHGNK